MIKIIEELDAASHLLRAALDRYLSVCYALKGCYTQINTTSYFPPELLHHVTDELSLVNTYEMSIKEAKVTLSRSRNSFPTIMPINVLPDEILSRIFHLVLDAQPSIVDSSRPMSLNHIDVCPLVCSRWRRISVSLGTLWSRIELCLVKSRERSVTRAAAYVARAGHAPLDVHISDNRAHGYGRRRLRYSRTCTSVAKFLTSIAPRIRSLTLGISKPAQPISAVLSACFANCVPGILTRLEFDASIDCRFLVAAEDPKTPEYRSINVPKQHLEGLWLHVTVLRLRGLYLPWTSEAYHGLTRLSLLPGSPSKVYIPEQQLVEILKASPQLRVLRFGLTITDPLPADAPVVPAHLECLEVLVWQSMHTDQLGAFLRLIAPGSKPLQVSIGRVDQGDFVALDEMKRFFAHSNVTKLRLGTSVVSGLAPALLDPLPPLEVLVLDYFADTPHFTPAHHTDELTHESTYPAFRALCLIRCHTHMDELRRVIKRYSVQALTINLGKICSDSTPADSAMGISEEEIKETLHATCPAVTYPGWKDELEDWMDLS